MKSSQRDDVLSKWLQRDMGMPIQRTIAWEGLTKTHRIADLVRTPRLVHGEGDPVTFGGKSYTNYHDGKTDPYIPTVSNIINLFTKEIHDDKINSISGAQFPSTIDIAKETQGCNLKVSALATNKQPYLNKSIRQPKNIIIPGEDYKTLGYGEHINNFVPRCNDSRQLGSDSIGE